MSKDGICLVVGYEGSTGARAAVRWAAVSLPKGGRLVLVCATRGLHVPLSPLSSASERRDLGRAFLDELELEGEEALIDVLSHSEISEADPVSALIDAASRYGADGIVVGREQHSRLQRAIGTVTSELLARSPVPVTTVPSEAL